jgi:DNA primase/KaiC/GvpD/RAD55 family RecA-like ATPase
VSFGKACEWLAENFAPHLLEEIRVCRRELSPAQLLSEAYETAFDICKRALLADDGNPGQRYLLSERGYDREILKDADFGYMVNPSIVHSTLISHYESSDPEMAEFIREKVYLGGAEEPPAIVIPARDRFGRSSGLMKRYIPVDGVQPQGLRWSSTKGTSKADPLLLDKCDKNSELLVVEGVFDVVYMTAMGVRNVVALGQGRLSKDNIKGFQNHGVKRIILMLDNDLPKSDGSLTGIDNTEAAVRLCISQGIEPFVIDPRKMKSLADQDKHVKDPDEYFREYGEAALKYFIANETESGVGWLARRLAEKNDIREALGKSRFIDNCCGVSCCFSSALPRIRDEFHGVAAELANVSKTDLMTEFATVERRIADDKSRKEMEAILRKGLAEKNIDNTLTALEDLKDRSKLSTTVVLPEFDFDAVLQRALMQNIEGLKIGFGCFDGTDEEPRFRLKCGGTTVIAGDSGVGKTTLMLNMMHNMMDLYPEKAFVFITYEEAAEALLFKFINMRSRVVINSCANTQGLARAMKNTQPEQWDAKIIEAVNELRRLSQEKRFHVVNGNFDVNELVAIIEKYCATYDVGAIFVDYIQKIPIKKEFSTQQLKLKEISDLLRSHTQRLGIAFIIGSQINKEGLIREAMDIMHDANLVMKISYTTKNDMFRGGIGCMPEKGRGDDIVDGYRTLTIEKGRDISTAGSMILDFKGEFLRLTSLNISEMQNARL